MIQPPQEMEIKKEKPKKFLSIGRLCRDGGQGTESQLREL
jgi:hypothetical protein